jgi:outer membrane lipoprotein-sorting protein
LTPWVVVASMKRLKVAFGLALAVASTGCAVSGLAPPLSDTSEPRKATLDEVLAAHEAYCSTRTFSASGELEVRDLRAGKSRKLGVRVVAARGGRLYLKGSVLVVTALEVVCDGERFWFQVPSKKTVWTGPNDAPHRAEGADEAPYYVLRPGDLTSAFLPEALTPREGEVLLFEADRQSVSVVVGRVSEGRGPVRRRVSFDRETLHVLRARSFDEHGDVISEASFGGWKGEVPSVVTVARPAEGYVASFVFDKAQVNVAIPERAFTPRMPEGYAVKEVGE